MSVSTRAMSIWYRITSYGAAIGAIASILFFALGNYRFSWAAILVVILSAELRVQVGGRLPRTRLFFIHLLAAIPLFVMLTILAFFVENLLLEIATAIAGIIAFGSGIVLWHRGLQRRSVESSRPRVHPE